MEVTDMYHVPVMLKACIEGLNINPEGVYVDATFGGGGHSKAILKELSTGKLVAFDQDDDARLEAEKIKDRSLTFCQANFRYLKRYLKMNGISGVNGVLADLGISSHQIDAPERGFSTRFDGPLDMRMDTQSSTTAADVVNKFEEGDLHRILGMYGEIRNARTAANAIVQYRSVKKLKRNFDLIEALKAVAPKGKENKYFAQVFQALRIEVNHEMDALTEFLQQCEEVIRPGGRLVVMSYHSLEDRMVKNYINTGKVRGELEKDFYGNPVRPFKAVNRKPFIAGQEEIESNKRARSAKLRIAERV
jgi:16S rRNA (cytosine1402-N4)-methyltransferase